MGLGFGFRVRVRVRADAHRGGVARDERERLVVLERVSGLVPRLRRRELAAPVGLVTWLGLGFRARARARARVRVRG